jgi:hypothetical protein
MRLRVVVHAIEGAEFDVGDAIVPALAAAVLRMCLRLLTELETDVAAA